MDGLREIAAGLIDAEIWFRHLVVEMIGCSDAQAEEVRLYYVKHKIMKADHISRRYNVKHGIFLEPKTLEDALYAATR